MKFWIVSAGTGKQKTQELAFENKDVAISYIHLDFDFLTLQEKEKLVNEGHIEWPPLPDQLDWIKLKEEEV